MNFQWRYIIKENFKVTKKMEKFLWRFIKILKNNKNSTWRRHQGGKFFVDRSTTRPLGKLNVFIRDTGKTDNLMCQVSISHLHIASCQRQDFNFIRFFFLFYLFHPHVKRKLIRAGLINCSQGACLIGCVSFERYNWGID